VRPPLQSAIRSREKSGNVNQTRLDDRILSNTQEDGTPSAGRGGSGGAFYLLAMLTTFATFLLIFMGGLVTSHQAGMSVPDWPNSYGYNMFLFPPRLWIGGILYEHTHRLMATVVGCLAIGLVVIAFRSRSVGRRERWLAMAVLGAVIIQGVLGGLRVIWVKLDLAIVHACVAQAFFCLAAFTALSSSRWWNDPDRVRPERSNGRGLVMLGFATVGVIYLQLIVGAMMRHFQAGLAIPDLPLAYGKLLPPVSQQGLDAANWARVRQWNLDPVSLEQIWLHFGHRIGAVLVSIMVIALASLVIRRYRMRPKLMRPALLLIVLLAAQVTLGVLTVLLRKPADVASAHVAVGALVLVTSFVLTARAVRIFGFGAAANRLVREDSAPTIAEAQSRRLVPQQAT
jgi:cytochrome c oxidase assembly protein subunit 15